METFTSLTKVFSFIRYEVYPVKKKFDFSFLRPSLFIIGLLLYQSLFSQYLKYFTENTSVNLGLQGSCLPMYDMSNDPFPLCSSCDPDVNSISGAIYKETGEPVMIVLNANLDPDNICDTTVVNPVEGITIRASSEQPNGCECDSEGCPEQIIGTTTDPCGFYSEVFACNQNHYSIQPFKNIGWLNGVTTYDIVLITKHILGVEFLDSPYKIIAADANNSGTVTTFDLVALRKLILAVNSKLTTNTSWRFVPADYVFSDPANPFPEGFPECITVDMTNQAEAQDRDFIAIKVGDVNLTADTGCGNNPPFTGGGDDRTAGIVQLHCVAGEAAAGESMEALFYVKSASDLVAWQGGLWFDTDFLELEATQPGPLDYMTPANFGLTEKEEGKLRVLWYAEDTKALPFYKPREAFRLTFRVKRSFDDWSKVLRLDDEVLAGAAWNDDGLTYVPLLVFQSEPFVQNAKQLQQPVATAIPNPFSGQVTIRVELPSDEWIAVEIFDTTGRRLAQWQGETTDRKAEVNFDSSGWGKGNFTYRVLTARKVLSGKIQR